jgi:hypothetical protein
MNRLLLYLGFLTLLVSCTQQEQYQVKDLTDQIDIGDTLKSESIDEEGYYQFKFNNRQKKDLNELLLDLNTKSLQHLESDTNAFQLVMEFSWGSTWCGSPLLLSIFQDDEYALISTSESISNVPHTYSDSRSMDVDWPVIKQLSYKWDSESFSTLDQFINENEYWNQPSFLSYKEVGLDYHRYFLELRKGPDYKLLVKESSEPLLMDSLVLQFLKVTHYNDSVLAQINQ